MKNKIKVNGVMFEQPKYEIGARVLVQIYSERKPLSAKVVGYSTLPMFPSPDNPARIAYKVGGQIISCLSERYILGRDK